jgi:UDP-N-acetylmuramoyl-tripeptide--D-alanyl-D-alanine ligase
MTSLPDEAPAQGRVSSAMVRKAALAPCDRRLTRADIDRGIELGGYYMLMAQRPVGDFVYEVDWTTGRESSDDNAVRQAGATWGMALLYRETRDPAYRVALDRSLARWNADARTADGRRWQSQGGADRGQLGTVALVGLSLLERLVAPEGLADPAATRASLDAICAFMEAARLPGGGFHGKFDVQASTPSGKADPYSSGEALLLLARSGLELGVPDRVARALAWAEEDYHLFVTKPLAEEPDPDLTKGYYQWSSMTWFALASAGHEPEIWGRRLIEQAHWMVDVHRTLSRGRNTGYAYEGIIPAWEWARRIGDGDTARKLACVAHQGLRKICSWQLGHPLAPAALRSAPERYHGGVQNSAKEPGLRIDVTQHQMHALMYARQFGIDTAEHWCDQAAPLKAEARRGPTAEVHPVPKKRELARERGSPARRAVLAPCDGRLTRADIDTGIELGGYYMLMAQRPEGNFVYEVDWTTGRESSEDNAVRQAGATWGMALLYRDTKDPTYRVALDRSLAWWDADARMANGRRWQNQHGANRGALGGVALVGLSLLERLAAPEGLADPAETRASLDAICTFLEAARQSGGGFHGKFDVEDGTPSGKADPYSSGEALLLLVRSGLELAVPARVVRALAWAEEDYNLFVTKPLAKEPDPDLSKGYYQWSSMTWFAFASVGLAPEIWGRRLIEQAHWMVDVHRTLSRGRNTGYAYEGIIPAWEWARRIGDEVTARKLACVTHQGLRKLCSYQLGHPLAPAALRSAPERFHGGVQNHAEEPGLRIDVTQHQMHALMYAREFGIDTAEHWCDQAASLKVEARRAPSALKAVRSAVLPGLPLTEIRPVSGDRGSKVASLVFVGDTSLGDCYLAKPQLSEQAQRLEENPWSFVESLAPLLDSKSLLVANLETVLGEGLADPFGGMKEYQGWDRPERTLTILQRLGVDVVSLANNHTKDYGSAPLLATIAHLKSAGILAFGAGANAAEAAKPLSFAAPFGNLHIFAGFQLGENYARKWNFYASHDAPGVNPLSSDATTGVLAAIARTRANDPGSVIIVYPHWGKNYAWASERMIELNNGMLSAGADFVIGHGAHQMQEIISGPEGAGIFSLGNFVFNSPGRYRKYNAPPFSLVARLDLERQASGIAAHLRLYPIASDNRETGFRPRPVNEREAAEAYDLLAGRDLGGFRNDFALEQDERGWCLCRSMTLRAKGAGTGAPKPRADVASEDISSRRLGWTPQELAEITGGSWEIMPPAGWTMKSLAFAERRLKPQALVIPKSRTYRHWVGLEAIRDPRASGYALLIDDSAQNLPADMPRLKVASVREAVSNLAVANRPTFPGRIVAITGSAGKTTTCNMIEDLLQVFGVPKRPTRNFNTFNGLNGELANLGNEAVAVLEVAVSYLSKTRPDALRPDVALITNIGEAHLETYGSPQGIAETKSNLFDLMPRGTAVIPRDSSLYDYLVQRAQRARAVIVSFGTSPEADARLLSYSLTDGLVEAEIFGKRLTYQLGALGRHFALDSVAALAVVGALGLDWRRAAGALATSTELTGRGEVVVRKIGGHNVTVIDDAYNANPKSMRAALELLSLRPVAHAGRRIAVLADMLELGPDSLDFHTALVDPILQSGADSVYLMGQYMQALWDVLPARIRGGYARNTAELQTLLESAIAEGDVILFKGSRGSDLHKVVKSLGQKKKRVAPASVAGDTQRSIALSAQAAIVLKIPSTGVPQPVYEKNPQGTFPPASLTKLLTVITALDIASRFGRSVITTIEMSAADSARGSGSNISVGDRFSLQDAIANMMLASSNTTANVVARTFGQLLVDREESGADPVRRFVQEMNATAASLGMSNSTFVHPSGLNASKQVTSAADMAKLLLHAAERPAISRVWGRATYNMAITGPNARTQEITSSIKMIGDDNVRGGKTGTHGSKTVNLAIYSQTAAGTKLASVILHSASDDARYADMRILLSALGEV